MSSGAARADTLVPLKVSLTPLGRPPISRFAFDPAVADRVVACSALSTDGGRTWPRLEANVLMRPLILGGVDPVAPVAGPDGRFLCGDMILPRANLPASGLGDVHPATEWDGQAFTGVGLPTGTSDYASQPIPTTTLAYASNGQPLAVRGREVLLAEARYEAPGELVAFAMDGRGRVVGATRRGKHTDLMAASALGAAWVPVEAPGIVTDIAAAGDRMFVAADLLGTRDAEGAWRWTAWPANVQAERLAVHGDTVLAWGRLHQSAFHAGVLAISRDGGATMRYAVLEQRPLWVAIDPHHPNQLLAMLESRGQRQLARLTIE